MIIPFVSVNSASEAIEFYKDVFNAEMNQEITYLSDIPGYEADEFKGKIGHSTLIISGNTIFLNDLIESHPLTMGNNIQFVLDFETEEKLRDVFQKVMIEGKLVAELQEVHWGALFGTVEDKFGITWQMYYGHK